MTKAKARERAKAKRLQKLKKRVSLEATPDKQHQTGRFDPNATAIKGPGQNNNMGNFGGARKGASRSK